MDRKILRTMLRIGNKGFTLVEVMVTIAILSFGIVMLYEAFFTCLNGFSYSKSRLGVQRWTDEKIWEVEHELIRSRTLITGESAGSFIDKNKNFAWKMSINLIDEAQDAYLYKLSLDVNWKEAQKNVSLSQVAYVQN